MISGRVIKARNIKGDSPDLHAISGLPLMRARYLPGVVFTSYTSLRARGKQQ
jgi:hypothetical protein